MSSPVICFTMYLLAKLACLGFPALTVGKLGLPLCPVILLGLDWLFLLVACFHLLWEAFNQELLYLFFLSLPTLSPASDGEWLGATSAEDHRILVQLGGGGRKAPRVLQKGFLWGITELNNVNLPQKQNKNNNSALNTKLEFGTCATGQTGIFWCPDIWIQEILIF